MKPGQIVEFIEAGRIVSAVCLEERKGRVRALTENRREINLSPNRLVHVSEEPVSVEKTRDGLAEEIQRRSNLREDLVGSVDVKALWELLHDQERQYEATELAELAFSGSITDDHRSAVVRAMLSDRIYFRFRTQGFTPNDPETVDKILTQRAREQEKERQILSGGQWIRSIFAGRRSPPPEGCEQIVDLLKEYAIHGKNAPHARHIEEILRNAGATHSLSAFRILVKLGIWSEDENLLIQRYGTRRAFPESALKEAHALNEQSTMWLSSDSGREDLSEHFTVTIDSSYTRDVDDALSVKMLPDGCLVAIHIADVSSVVPLGSQVDAEAYLRATSLYLPEESIPMLPPAISEELCSLSEGKSRPAISLLIEVDGQGRIGHHRFCLSEIIVNQRLSYEEADRVMQTSENPLSVLLKIARDWREERIRNGALLLPLPEVTVRLDDEGRMHLEQRDRESPSQILVSEMMIQANRLVGKHLNLLQMPCVYRCQEEPRERILEGSGGGLLQNYQQRKLLSRAELRLDPAFHHGLGTDDYATATSPIRRYLDLVVQRQLRASITEASPVYSRDDLSRILMETEETLNQANQMEIARQRYWLLRYLQGEKGQETPAVVLGRYGNRFQLLLPEYMLEVGVSATTFSWLREGEDIRVRILQAKPMQDELQVEPR